MKNFFKNLFTKNAQTPAPNPEPTPVEVPQKPRKPRKKKVVAPPPQLSPKELATQNNEPYVQILKIDINPENISEGSFELDWNEIFVARLVKNGYMKKKTDTDAEIVDRWFSDVARSIVLEMHEQIIADPAQRDLRIVKSKDIGNGRTEIS